MNPEYSHPARSHLRRASCRERSVQRRRRRVVEAAAGGAIAETPEIEMTALLVGDSTLRIVARFLLAIARRASRSLARVTDDDARGRYIWIFRMVPFSPFPGETRRNNRSVVFQSPNMCSFAFLPSPFNPSFVSPGSTGVSAFLSRSVFRTREFSAVARCVGRNFLLDLSRVLTLSPFPFFRIARHVSICYDGMIFAQYSDYIARCVVACSSLLSDLTSTHGQSLSVL